MNECSVYTLRPDNTALWLPAHVAEQLGIKYGDRLSPGQYENRVVQDLIAERLRAEKADKMRKGVMP